MKLNITKEDAIEIIQHIKVRINKKLEVIYDLYDNVNGLEKELKQDLLDEGKCFHLNTHEITDISDYRQGYKVYKCEDCNTIIKKER